MAVFEVIVSHLMLEMKITYRSYLLRLWHAGEPDAQWRAMLESVAEPGERHYFKDLEGLTAYLLTQPENPPETVEAEGGQER